MPDAPIIGQAQVEIGANLDRLDRDLARAEAATHRFDQAASAALARTKTSADLTSKAYETFSASVQRAEQAFTKLNSQLSGAAANQLQQLKAATIDAANAYGRYVEAAQAAGAAHADFRQQAEQMAVTAKDTAAALTPVNQVLADMAPTVKTVEAVLSPFIDALSYLSYVIAPIMAKATAKMTEAVDDFKEAAAKNVAVEFFKSASAAAEDLNIDVDQLFKAFENLKNISQASYKGSALDQAIARLRLGGELRGNTGVEALRVATTNTEKFIAVNTLITEAYQKGQMLAALDLAKKWLPPELFERFKAFPDLLDQINKKIEENKPEDTTDLFFAKALQNQIDDADKALTGITDKWTKEMAKPWLQRPWFAFFRELNERIEQWGNLADAQVKKFIFGLTGARREIARVRYEFTPEATGAPAAEPDAFTAAAERLRRQMVSPTRGGFGVVQRPGEGLVKDPASELRWTQEYADAVTKLSVNIRDYSNIIRQAQQANEVYRAVLGGDVDETLALGHAYRLAKEHIDELGVSTGEGAGILDQSAGAIARVRLETTLWDAALKTAIQTGQPLEAFLQREGPHIRAMGKALQEAVETKQFAADITTIISSLGSVATAEEVLLTKQLHLNQVLAASHGLMTVEQQARAKQAISIEVSNQFLARRTELLGEATTITDTMTAMENKLTQATLAKVRISQDEIETIRRNTFERAAGVRNLQQQVDAQRAETSVIGMTIADATTFKLILEKLNQAMREGKVLTQEEVDAWTDWATALGRATEMNKAANEAIQITNNLQAQNIAIRALTAKSPQERADIAMAQKRNELEQQYINYAKNREMLAKLDAQVAKAGEVAFKTEIESLKEAARVRKQNMDFSVESSKAELAAAGLSIGEQYKVTEALRVDQELRAAAAASHTRVNKQEEAELLRLVDVNASLKQAMAERKAMSDAIFESQTMFFSDTERQIATLQRSLHGDEWKQFMNDGLAAMTRINAAIKEIRDALGTAASTFASNLVEGKTVLDSLKDSAKQLGSALLEAGTKALVNQSFGSLLSATGFTTQMTAGATAASTILTAAGATVGASLSTGAAIGAATLTGAIPVAAASLPIAGATAGTEVAVGGITAGAALEAGGVAAGAAIMGPIAALAAIAAGIVLSLFGKSGAQDQSQQLYQQQVQAYKDSQQRAQDYKRRAQLAVIDTSNLSGQLAAFDIEANRQRKEEAQKALPQMGMLEKALAAERLAIIKKFRDDTINAEKSFKESFVDEPLSDVAQKMKDMTEQGNKLIDAMKQLGQSTDQVAALMVQATDRIRSGFIADLTKELNSATGKGYLNDFTDLIKTINQKKLDATALGVDPALIDKLFKAQAQKLVDDAGLVGDAFNELLTTFPELNGVVHAATANIEALGKSINEYLNGLKFGQLSTLTEAQKFGAAQQAFATQYKIAAGTGPAATAAQGTITQIADQFLTIARSFLGPTEAYRKIYDEVTSQLAALPGLVATAASGGLVKGFATGGLVNNGVWGVDSVRAKYAGGGDIGLAGGEFIVPAPAVTPATLPGLESLRKGGSWGSSANDNSAVIMAFRSSREEMRQMRNENRTLLTMLARVAANGNMLSEQMIRELLNLRTDTRQGIASQNVRQKAS